MSEIEKPEGAQISEGQINKEASEGNSYNYGYEKFKALNSLQLEEAETAETLEARAEREGVELKEAAKTTIQELAKAIQPPFNERDFSEICRLINVLGESQLSSFFVRTAFIGANEDDIKDVFDNGVRERLYEAMKEMDVQKIMEIEKILGYSFAQGYGSAFLSTGHFPHVAGGIEEAQKEEKHALALIEKYNKELERIKKDAEERGIEKGRVLGRKEERKEVKKKAKAKDVKKTYRAGGHLTDQLLDGPQTDKGSTLDLFEQFKPATREKITEAHEIVYQNMDGRTEFSPGEHKMILAFQEILHKKSNIAPSAGEMDYYTGNGEALQANAEGFKGKPIPALNMSIYEITQVFKNNDKPTSKDFEEVRDILARLQRDDKKVLMRYKRFFPRTRKVKGKVTELEVEQTIEEYAPLINVSVLDEKEREGSGGILSHKRDISVRLHPLFIDQIKTKWVEKPTIATLEEANAKATGSKSPGNFSKLLLCLTEELSRAKSNNLERGVYPIGEEKLFNRIAPQYMPPNEKRLPLIRKQLSDAIKTLKEAGLILQYEMKPGITAEIIHHFKLK